MNKNTNPFEEHGLTQEDANLSVDLTLASEKAWVKMSRSGLSDPLDWLVCLVESAIMNDATTINVKLSETAMQNLLNTGLLEGAPSIVVSFNSNPFSDDFSRLPFHLVSHGESKESKILNLLATGIAGAIGCGAKKFDLSFYTGSGTGRRLILNANNGIKSPEIMLQSTNHSRLSISFMYNESKALEAFLNLEKKVSLIAGKPLGGLASVITLYPKQKPDPQKIIKEVSESYFTSAPLFSSSFSYGNFWGFILISPLYMSSTLYFTRNYINLLIMKNIDFPWSVPTKLIIENPDFTTDLSRKTINKECQAYKDALALLPKWQEYALNTLLSRVFTSDRASGVRIFFYNFLNNNSAKIQEWHSKYKNGEIKEDKTSFIWKLFHAPIFLTMTPDVAKRRSFFQKIGLEPVIYKPLALYDLFCFHEQNIIFIVTDNNFPGKFNVHGMLYIIGSVYTVDYPSKDNAYNALSNALSKLFPGKVLTAGF